MQRWQLVGYEVVDVVDFCANPDDDPGGKWCFVLDIMCQHQVNWGYCAPEPRCAPGSIVLAPSEDLRMRAAQITSFHGKQVTLLWNSGGTGTAKVSEVTTLSGEPCLHTRSSSLDNVADEASDGRTSIMPSTAAPPSPRASPIGFDHILHGPALAVRLEWDYTDVVLQLASFERLLVHAVARAVQQPQEAVIVLAVMRGSVIAAMGVVPQACTDTGVSPECLENLVGVRRLWLAALQNPGSELRSIFQRMDLTFPSVLTWEDCAKRNLPCLWLQRTPSPMPSCDDSASQECIGAATTQKGEHDIWWFMSLLAFAGATPTCLCLSLGSLKGILLCWRWSRRRRHRREVQLETSALARVEVLPEDMQVGEDWACAICLGEQVAGTDMLLLPCKHTLHYDCMLGWLHQKLSCPMCRVRIQLSDCAIYTTPCRLPAEDLDASQEGSPSVPSMPKASLPLSSRPSLPNAVADDDDDEHV